MHSRLEYSENMELFIPIYQLEVRLGDLWLEYLHTCRFPISICWVFNVPDFWHSTSRSTNQMFV